jgi:hypothetical protein
MNTIVENVPKSHAAEAQITTKPFSIVALFCGIGLLASLCMMSFGLDVGAGFF